MSVVYWGASVSGKLHVEMLYRYNYKSISMIKTGFIQYGKSQKNGEGSIYDVERYSTDGVDKRKLIVQNHEEYFSDWMKLGWGIGKDFLYSVDENKELIFPYSRTKPIYRSQMIKYFPHWSQADVYINCLDLLGLNPNAKRFSLIKSVDDVNIYDDIIIDDLRQRKNIVPYKSNMREHMLYYMLWIAHIKRIEPDVISVRWMIKYHRLIEQILEKYGFDITYFDIDTDDYAKTFGVDKNISRSCTKTRIRDDAPIDKLYDMIDRYIEENNIRDIRLQNSQYDNILFQ